MAILALIRCSAASTYGATAGPAVPTARKTSGGRPMAGFAITTGPSPLMAGWLAVATHSQLTARGP